MTVLCPKCGSEEFYFVQECTEHHTMEAIYEDGNIDLYALEASHPHEENHLYCEHCEWEGSLKQYFETKKEEDSG